MKQNITLIALILWTTALVSAQDLSFEQNFEQEVLNLCHKRSFSTKILTQKKANFCWLYH